MNNSHPSPSPGSDGDHSKGVRQADSETYLLIDMLIVPDESLPSTEQPVERPYPQHAACCEDWLSGVPKVSVSDLDPLLNPSQSVHPTGNAIDESLPNEHLATSLDQSEASNGFQYLGAGASHNPLIDRNYIQSSSHPELKGLSSHHNPHSQH